MIEDLERTRVTIEDGLARQRHTLHPIYGVYNAAVYTLLDALRRTEIIPAVDPDSTYLLWSEGGRVAIRMGKIPGQHIPATLRLIRAVGEQCEMQPMAHNHLNQVGESEVILDEARASLILTYPYEYCPDAASFNPRIPKIS